MSRKSDKDDELDSQTTFADMNVEGFSWYDPTKKKSKDGKNKTIQKVSRKEYRQIVRGAFAAILPVVAIFLASMAIVGILLYLWLK